MYRHLTFALVAIGSLFLLRPDVDALPYIKLNNIQARRPDGVVVPFSPADVVYQATPRKVVA